MDEETIKIINQVKSEKDVFSKAKLLIFLKKEKDLSITNLAKSLFTTPSNICNLLRLLRLPEIIIDGYYSNIISVSHLMTISRLKSEENMILLYEEVLSKNLTVAQTDNLIREKLFNIITFGDRIDKNTKNKIKNKYQNIDKDIEVEIVQTRIRAKVNLTIKGNFQKTTEVLRKLASDN